MYNNVVVLVEAAWDRWRKDILIAGKESQTYDNVKKEERGGKKKKMIEEVEELGWRLTAALLIVIVGCIAASEIVSERREYKDT